MFISINNTWVGTFLVRNGNLSCTERTAQRKEFELILTVKMETRHPVKGHLAVKFPAICNDCEVMTA